MDVAALYRVIKPNIVGIINTILPKAMSLTNEERDLWSEDPVRFVNQVNDMEYEYFSVRSESGSFIKHLAKVRAGDILTNFLQYLQTSFSHFSSQEASQEYAQKEWMLYALELLAKNILSKNDLVTSMEEFLYNYVFPEFQSSIGFLRARACCVYAAFDKLPFSSEEHKNAAISSILNCLNDNEFPVCVTAALSLAKFINESTKVLFAPYVIQIVEKLIYILQTAIVEEIMSLFNDLLNTFEQELIPLSMQILQVLFAAFENYTKDEENDNAFYTAVSTFDCIVSIVRNACSKQEYYDSVTAYVFPYISVLHSLIH